MRSGSSLPTRTAFRTISRRRAGWGAPLLIGEYGIDPGAANADAWITAELDLQDRLRAHSAFWLWEELSGGYWGLFDGESSEPGGERLDRTTALSRTYARAVPGRVLEHAFDAAANTLRLRYRANSVTAVEMFAPPRRYPAGVALRCDGRALRPRRAGAIVVHCGAPGAEHVLELAPRG